jgi:hypothetical protein
MNGFINLPMLFLSYAIFSDVYSWGQTVGLAFSVASSMGYAYCSLPQGSSLETMHQSPRHSAGPIYSCCNRRSIAVVSVTLCVGGLVMSNHLLNVFQLARSSTPYRMDRPDHSLSSCFHFASMCYGNWTKDASLVPINHSASNVVWFIESEVSVLSPSRDRGRAAIGNVLVGIRHFLSRGPSRHYFIRDHGSGVVSENARLMTLFNDIGIENYQISLLSVNQRDALTRMLIADVVIGSVGSIVDIVSQFSASPFVIQILYQHEDSAVNMLFDVDAATHHSSSMRFYYFIGSWLDASAIPAGQSNLEISDKLSAYLASSDRLTFLPFTHASNCDENRVFEACRKHFPAGQKRDSCFWGVRSRHSDSSIQLAELFAFIMTSLRGSLEFVYEPFHQGIELASDSSENSWLDDFFGISRLMQVLEVTTVRPNGQPGSLGHRCSKLVRQSYSESVLSANRNPHSYAEHMCPSCVFKGAQLVNAPSSSESASSKQFSGHRLNVTASTRTKPLSCDGLNSKPRTTRDLVPGWPQTRLSESVTPSESVCYHQRSFRRCHDVHANLGDGVSVRTCQWRLPDGPCEVIDRGHREQLVAVTKGHAFLDAYPLVQLAWRTQVFGVTPSFSGPKGCARADEIIACEQVDGTKGQSFWDKVRGASNPLAAHGSIWHLRDSPGKVHA